MPHSAGGFMSVRTMPGNTDAQRRPAWSRATTRTRCATAHFETAISMYEDLGEATAADACRGYLDHERKLEAKGMGGIDE